MHVNTEPRVWLGVDAAAGSHTSNRSANVSWQGCCMFVAVSAVQPPHCRQGGQSRTEMGVSIKSKSEEGVAWCRAEHTHQRQP